MEQEYLIVMNSLNIEGEISCKLVKKEINELIFEDKVFHKESVGELAIISNSTYIFACTMKLTYNKINFAIIFSSSKIICS